MGVESQDGESAHEISALMNIRRMVPLLKSDFPIGVSGILGYAVRNNASNF